MGGWERRGGGCGKGGVGVGRGAGYVIYMDHAWTARQTVHKQLEGPSQKRVSERP